MVMYNSEKRRVECEKCGKVLLLQTNETNFCFCCPQDCNHYKVIECFEFDCNNCLLREISQRYPTSNSFVYCIVPKDKVRYHLSISE